MSWMARVCRSVKSATLYITEQNAIVRKTGATPSQVALAWVLKRSPVMLPIPGTSKVAHLEDNVRAASIELPAEDFAALDLQAKKAA